MPISKHNLRDHMDPEEGYNVYNCGGAAIPAAYFKAIGHFLIECAEIEASLHRVIRELLPLDERQTRVLIGQARVTDLLETLSKLRQLQDFTREQAALLREAKRYIRYTFNVRAILAHQVPAWRKGWLRYDRLLTAKDISDRANLLYVIKIDELANLTEFGLVLRTAVSVASNQNPAVSALAANRRELLQSFVETHPLPADPAAQS